MVSFKEEAGVGNEVFRLVVSRPLFLPVISKFQVYVLFCVFSEKAFSAKLSAKIYLNYFSKFFR